MGKNFLGIREAIKYFTVTPTEKQLLQLSEIPFSEKMLEECGHRAVRPKPATATAVEPAMQSAREVRAF
jgi:hypothetical protein